jgi:hypothetical protein
MGVFQKQEAILFGLIKLILSKRFIAEDIDPEKIEGFSNRLIDLRNILNNRGRRFDSGDFFYFEIDLFRKSSSEGGDLEIGFSGDMIYRGIEGFDGGVDGHLDTDKDTYSKGNARNREEGSPSMVAKVTEGDISEEVK